MREKTIRPSAQMYTYNTQTIAIRLVKKFESVVGLVK